MKITKEFVKILIDDILLELTDDEIEEVLRTENDILNKFEKVFLINTDNVKESHYAFDFKNSYMRDDDEQPRVILKEEMLQNAPVKKDGFVVLNKVVK